MSMREGMCKAGVLLVISGGGQVKGGEACFMLDERGHGTALLGHALCTGTGSYHWLAMGHGLAHKHYC